MMWKHIRAACMAAALWVTTCVAIPAHAADQPSPPPMIIPERLSFPDTSTTQAPAIQLPDLIAAPAPQQMVALPTPQFTGISAVAVLAILLSCRKSILRLVC